MAPPRSTVARQARRGVVLVAVLALLAAGCGEIVTFEAADATAVARPSQTSVVVAADGTVLASLHGLEDRTEVPLEDVAEELVQAVVAVEDRRFFTHAGVDVPGVVRALRENVAAGAVEQGGSTITQQYVKNTVTGDATTMERKIEEAVLAWQLEQDLGKDEILERYLNTVYFGGGAYGVSAASRSLFGVAPDEVTLEQAALLAGLIRSPSALDPRNAPDAARTRRGVVLDALVRLGAVTRERADVADAAPLGLAPPPEADPDAGGWFVDEVRRVVTRDERFAALGSTVDERVDALLTGGLRVTTTLDPRAQARAEEAVLELLPEEDDPSAAVVVLEPGTGAVRALVGGRTDDGVVGGFSTATMALRQPGSAFKPVVLAAALEAGVPLTREFAGGACRTFEEVPGWDTGVCNYGDTEYDAMTLREATVRSVNTAYAELGVELGPTAMLRQARQLGITADLPRVHALALGAGEVTPLELATAYAPFATLGMHHDVHVVARIEGPDGEVLYEHQDAPRRVLDEQTAHLVTTTLEEVVDRGTGVLADIDRPQAGKTGTSQDSADAWFVGYTPDLLAAVWIGFADGRRAMVPPATRERVEGGRWPAELWASIMGPTLADRPPTPFERPADGVVRVEVDVTRDCLPNPYTPAELVEEREYAAGTAPTQRCTEPTGPPVDDVPSLVGLPVGTALQLLGDQGFAVEQRPVEPILYPAGVVELQRPAPGGSTTPEDGNAVVLWVSTTVGGRVSVPEVGGLARADAVASLETAGFVVDERTVACALPSPAPTPTPTPAPSTEPSPSPSPATCPRPGTVAAQSPSAGALAAPHAVVRLDVVAGEDVPTR